MNREDRRDREDKSQDIPFSRSLWSLRFIFVSQILDPRVAHAALRVETLGSQLFVRPPANLNSGAGLATSPITTRSGSDQRRSG